MTYLIDSAHDARLKWVGTIGGIVMTCDEARAMVAKTDKRTEDNWEEVDVAVNHVQDCPVCKEDKEFRAQSLALWPPPPKLGPMTIEGGCLGGPWVAVPLRDGR